MTPPPAATTAGRIGRRAAPSRGTVPRRRGAPPPRRRIGALAALPAPAPALPRIAPPSRGGALRLGSAVADRLRGRALIFALAAALLGLVFLQISLLKLNTSISANVERAQSLERGNATKRALISRLDAGQRIQEVAGQLGMVMPGAGAVCYLRAVGGGGCSGGDPAAAAGALDTSASTAPTTSIAEAAAPDLTPGDAAGGQGASAGQEAPAAQAPAAQAPAAQQAPQAPTTETPAPSPPAQGAGGGLAATGG